MLPLPTRIFVLAPLWVGRCLASDGAFRLRHETLSPAKCRLLSISFFDSSSMFIRISHQTDDLTWSVQIFRDSVT
jgi:hypothetical protein